MPIITDEHGFVTGTIPPEIRDRLYTLAEKFNNDVLLHSLKDMPGEITLDDPIAGSQYKYTPLTRSVMIIDSTEMFDLLIEAGASIDQRDGYGKTALETAIEIGHVDAVEDCIRHKADVNLLDMDDNTPFIRSILRGGKRIVDLLIDNGADINLPSKNSDHPVIIAENMGNEYVLNRLKEHKNFLGYHLIEKQNGNDDHSSLVPEATTAAVASNLTQNAVELIANHTTSIGNTSNSTELRLAMPDLIIHNASAINPDGCSGVTPLKVVKNVLIGVGVVMFAGVGLFAAAGFAGGASLNSHRRWSGY